LKPLIALFVVTVFYSWSFGALDLSYSDPEFFHQYPAFRTWFLDRLLSGSFPIWNPYWGIGHSTQIENSIPLDLFSVPEALGLSLTALRPLQMFCVLLAGYAGLRWLEVSKPRAALAAVAFFISPWVLNQFFFFPTVTAYLGLLLGAPLTYRWMERGERKDWLALALCVFFTGFGLRTEHWGFNFTFFTGIAVIAAVQWRKPKALAGFALALGLAAAAHAWQLIPLFQIARESDRGAVVGQSALAHAELYRNLFYSAWDSLLVKLLALALALWLITDERLWRQALGSLGVVLLFFPSQVIGLATPYGAGAGLALLAWYSSSKPGRRELVKTLALFLPLSYYWARPGDGDLREIAVLHLAPAPLHIFFGAMTWFAARAARATKAGRVFYMLFLGLFFVRDQGQILSAYLTGLLWVPTHDNYLLDFTLLLLGGLGLGTLPKRAALITQAALAVMLFSVVPNKFYSLPLAKSDPQSLSHYTRIAGSEEVLRALRDTPTWRSYFTRPGGLEASTLRLSANEITLHSTLSPRRFRDWTLYQRLAMPPAAHWSSYPAGYTSDTLAKLPRKEVYVYSNDIAHWWTQHAWLPRNYNLSRLLGVSHILSGEPIAPSPELNDYKRIGDYYTARVANPLPRAFLVPAMDEAARLAFSSDLTPVVGTNHVLAGGRRFPFKAAKVVTYEPERVEIETQSIGNTILVLSDLFHSFWTVSIDGKPAKQFPALYLLRGVSLPGGSHTVTFEARIPYFGGAVGVSLLALALILMRGLGRQPLLALRSRLGRLRSWRDPLGAYRSAGSSEA